MRVLIAIDRTPLSEQAVAATARLGLPPTATFILASVLDEAHIHATVAPEFEHVLTPEGTAGGQALNSREPAPRIVEDRGQALQRTHEDLTQYLEHLQARYLPSLEVACHISDSPHTAPALIKAARDFNADMIVVGTHGRAGVGRAVFGSVAEEVIRNSPVPVLVVGPAAQHNGK